MAGVGGGGGGEVVCDWSAGLAAGAPDSHEIRELGLINSLVLLIYGSAIAFISIWTNSVCAVGLGVSLPPRNRAPHCALGAHSTHQVLVSPQAAVETDAWAVCPGVQPAWVCTVSGRTSLDVLVSEPVLFPLNTLPDTNTRIKYKKDTVRDKHSNYKGCCYSLNGFTMVAPLNGKPL